MMCLTITSLLTFTLSLMPCSKLAESDTRIEAVAVYDGAFLCLNANGTVGVWNLKDWKYLKDASAQFTREKLTSLASDSDKLWAADDKVVYVWSAKDKKWEKLAAYEAGSESLISIIPAGGRPYLVFPSKVIDPTREKDGVFQIPKNADLFREPPLRILTTHGTESMVWIGTGNGEWGGTLIGLDPTTGKWVNSRKGGGYVTGITHSTKDEVIVSWAMSHFHARTRIMVHKADATVKTDHPSLADKYYQCLAYSTHDELLYGVEQGDVVTIKDGKPTKVTTLKGRLFEREPNAIGVAPGISRLLAVGPKTLIAIPTRGEPWLIREKEIIRLQVP